MKAHILMFVLFVTSTFVCGFSQKSIVKGLLTSDQQFIQAATDSAFFIVRQDYILRDTSVKNSVTYGRNNKPYFGRVYGLAILANGKLWIDSRLLKPWLIDPEYKTGQKSDSLVPECSLLSIRPIGSHSYKSYPEIKPDSDLNNDSTYIARGLAVLNGFEGWKGLPMNFECRDTSGWIVIVHSQYPLATNDSCNISLAVYHDKPAFGKQHQGTIKTPTQQNVIGGIYLSSLVTTGNIALYICGIVTRKPLNWVVTAIPQIGKKTGRQKSVLTPIQPKNEETGKQNKKDKNKKS
jgi:hypothetical protein